MKKIEVNLSSRIPALHLLLVCLFFNLLVSFTFINNQMIKIKTSSDSPGDMQSFPRSLWWAWTCCWRLLLAYVWLSEWSKVQFAYANFTCDVQGLRTPDAEGVLSKAACSRGSPKIDSSADMREESFRTAPGAGYSNGKLFEQLRQSLWINRDINPVFRWWLWSSGWSMIGKPDHSLSYLLVTICQIKNLREQKARYQ